MVPAGAALACLIAAAAPSRPGPARLTKTRTFGIADGSAGRGGGGSRGAWDGGGVRSGGARRGAAVGRGAAARRGGGGGSHHCCCVLLLLLERENEWLTATRQKTDDRT